MKRTTQDTTTNSDEELTAAAGRGDDASFTELHQRHAPLAWRLGLAVSGDPDDAAAAVADATGTTFTALRAGRFQASSHRVALATATRNAALDRRRDRDAIGSPAVADDADPLLAGAFAALPERWRSVLWLRDVEELSAADAASIVELSGDAVDQLAVRARRGLRDRYLRTQVAATTDRDCARAVARLGALADDTLNASDRSTLEGHLAGCDDCTARRDRLAELPAGLAALALPVPDDLRDRACAAWTASLASSTTTGLSPRTEKLIAGVSAMAAALGVVGAAVFGASNDADPVASPLAPLVSDIDTPPIDLGRLTRPLTTPDPITSTARRSLSPVPAATGGATPDGSAPAPASPGTTVPGADTSSDGTDRTPASEAPPTTIGDVPVDVDVNVGTDTSVTVGPVKVDVTPDEGDDVLGLDGPEVLDPVTEPVTETVNEVLRPVVDAVQPVVKPVTEALEPVTEPVQQTLDTVTGTVNDTVDQTVGGLTGGLGLGG